jgi:hypothetical protein
MGYFVHSDSTFSTVDPWTSVPFDKLLPIEKYAPPPYPGRTEIPIIDHGNRAFSENIRDILLAHALVVPEFSRNILEYLPKIEWNPAKFEGKTTVANSGGDFAHDGSPDWSSGDPYHRLHGLFRSVDHEAGHCLDPYINDPDARVGNYPDQPVEYRAEWYQVVVRQTYNRRVEAINQEILARQKARKVAPPDDFVPVPVRGWSSGLNLREIAAAWRTPATSASRFLDALDQMENPWLANRRMS